MITNREFRQIRRNVRKSQRAMLRDQRRVKRHMSAIRADLIKVYPSSNLVDAMSLLLDQDLVWSGDFDDLREPLAGLLFKLHSLRLLDDEVEQMARLLLCQRDQLPQ